MAEQAKQPSTFDLAFLTSGVGDVGEVLLIRHGQQEYDPRGTTQDLIDPPLSEHGRAQAQLLGKAFADTELAAIYASPLQRANDTAAALAGHHEVEVKVIDDLREIEIFRDVPRDIVGETSTQRCGGHTGSQWLGCVVGLERGE